MLSLPVLGYQEYSVIFGGFLFRSNFQNSDIYLNLSPLLIIQDSLCLKDSQIGKKESYSVDTRVHISFTTKK